MVLSVAHTFATLRPSLGLTLCPDAEFSVSVLGTLLSVSEPVSLWASAFVSPTTNILVRDVGRIIAHVLLTGIVGDRVLFLADNPEMSWAGKVQLLTQSLSYARKASRASLPSLSLFLRILGD